MVNITQGMELRKVEDGFVGRGASCATVCVMGAVEFLWALFQLFIASPLPFWLASQYGVEWAVLTGVKARAIHLSFALFLLFLVIPLFRKSEKHVPNIFDWVLSVVAMGAVLHIVVFYDDLAARVAMPNSTDIIAALLGMFLLFEGARRAIGLPIVAVAASFLLYATFGHIMPDVIAHKGHDLISVISHEWFTSEGIFGVALGVSCNFVFLYVMFGALLDKAGAGGFFMKLSIALLRGSVGGSAKAAVIGSGFMGMMSGSSVANTITVGTFTIPLMKKMGITPEKAAAIEVSAGINGQITPPVMGAAAFLMAEFLSLPYSDIVKHALVPALMVYVGLLVIVHFEACRLNDGSVVVGQKHRTPVLTVLLRIALCASSVVALFAFVHAIIDGVSIGSFHVSGIKDIFQGASIYAVAAILIVAHIAVLVYRPTPVSREFLSTDDKTDTGSSSESVWEIFRQGLHYFIPVVVLVWLLVVERVSSSLACFWTNVFLMFMLLSEGVVDSLRRGDRDILPPIFEGFGKICSAMVTSSKNMLAIAVATATAGIVVGVVGLTGFGLVIGSFVDVIAGSSVFVALLVTAVICIVLGMGMPTTGCYIIVSTLVVPVLTMMVHKNGLQAPPVALHLFVFYFGLMADVTPPVGIASYAAAAIARANAFKTGVQSFLYNIKTMVVPFVFVFNGDIILHSVESVWRTVFDIGLLLLSIILLSAGMQGFFLRRNRFYESVVLIVLAATFLVPGYVAGLFRSPYVNIPVVEGDASVNNRAISRSVSVRRGDAVMINFERPTGGKSGEGYVVVPIQDSYDGTIARMLSDVFDISVRPADDAFVVLDIGKGSYAYKDIEEGDSITGLVLKKKNNNGYYVCAVAFLVLVLLVYSQARSRKSLVVQQ